MGRGVLTIAFFVVFILGIVTTLFLTNSTVGYFLAEVTTRGPEASEASSNVVAVNANNAGVLGSMSVEIINGKGRVLINTNPFLEPDTQYSAEVAVKVAEDVSGRSIVNKDVIISFEMGDGNVVGGPSAGAAMTLAVLAALEGKRVRSDVVITGEIMPDGSISAVGGIMEKAMAAGESGAILFLVPKGQKEVTYYEKRVEEERYGPLISYTTYFVPKTLDLSDYASQWELNIREVGNIRDAATLVLV